MANLSSGSTARIMLRSSWQMHNIGDMAHAPGAIRLLADIDPAIDVVLWARRISQQEREMLQRWHPRLRVVTGELDEQGKASTPELAEEMAACTAFIHGSGRLLAGEPDAMRWAETGKPYGFFGITVDPLSPDGATNLRDMAALTEALGDDHLPQDRRALLSGASFVFCRDSISVDYLHRHGLTGEQVEFGPDAAFAFHHGDPDAADKIRERHQLADDGYLCIVPRLRYTPYHHMLGTPTGHPEQVKDAVNAVYREREFSVLTQVISHAVREHGVRVLLAPEMRYAVDTCAEIAAALPTDVADSVATLDHFWGPGAAQEVYRDAAAVISMECHSPILATRVGVPSLYLRQPTDTIKGRMWADLDMGDQVHEMESPVIDRIVDQTAGFLADNEKHRSAAAGHGAAAEELAGTRMRAAVSLL